MCTFSHGCLQEANGEKGTFLDLGDSHPVSLVIFYSFRFYLKANTEFNLYKIFKALI